MRAALQTAIGKMEICEIERPVPGPGEVVVAVKAALTCGTDRKILDRGHHRFKPPLVMGHEFSGVVAAVGPGSGWKEGDAVMGGISGPCGVCADCRRGASNRCESPDREVAWGAFAEYLRVPRRVAAQNLFPKPAGLPDESAAFLDPLACVVRGLARLDPRPDEPLLVLGAGPIGLLWVAAARASGIDSVAVLGKGEDRLALARRWGADAYDLLGPERPAAAPAVVECVGRPTAWHEAFALTAPGGRVLFFGGCSPGSAVTFDAARIHYEEITVTGSFHYRPEDAAAAREWLATGAILPGPLISGSGTLADLPAFLEKMRQGVGMKYAVRP